jgi:phage gpG-like protein
MPNPTLQVFGVRETIGMFDRGATAAKNMRPALLLVREDMFRVTKVQFESQGRRGGGSWRGLTEAWALRKEVLGRDPRILYSQHKLIKSWTERSSRNMRSRVTKDRIDLQSSLVYAGVHQFGYSERNIPERPYIKFVRGDHERWTKICMRHLQGAMIRGRR